MESVVSGITRSKNCQWEVTALQGAPLQNQGGVGVVFQAHYHVKYDIEISESI